MFATRRSTPPLVRHLEARLRTIVSFARGSHDDDRAFGTLGHGEVEILCLHPVFPDEVQLLGALGWDAFTDLGRDHVY